MRVYIDDRGALRCEDGQMITNMLVTSHDVQVSSRLIDTTTFDGKPTSIASPLHYQVIITATVDEWFAEWALRSASHKPHKEVSTPVPKPERKPGVVRKPKKPVVPPTR